MADLIVLFTTFTVFGVGVTIIDFLGIMDHIGNQDGNPHLSDSVEANDDSGGDSHDHFAGYEQHGSNLLTDRNKEQSELADSKISQKNGKPAFKIISAIMNVLRSVVYFSLGFGPTGLFAAFTGQSKTSGILWAIGVGAATLIGARLVRRLIRRDTDSSIKPDELLQERGVLLLPLEGELISKATVRQYGREIEIYVRCMDKNVKLSKGKEILIEEYDNDVYWVIPVETEGD